MIVNNPARISGENVSSITPHTLRRTFGSYLLNRGLRLEVVSRLLGHSSTVVTERAYAELLGTTIRDARTGRKLTLEELFAD